MSDAIAVRAFGAGAPIWLLHSLLADAGSCLPLANRLTPNHLAPNRLAPNPPVHDPAERTGSAASSARQNQSQSSFREPEPTDQAPAAFRAMVPDLPGFGGSPWPGPGLDATADALAPAIDQPAIVFGNGYGSFVALMLALRHPERVTKLILAGTGAAFSEPGRAAFRGMAAAAAAKGLDAIADVAMRRLFAPDFQAAHPELLAERRARFLQTDIAVFTAACAALAELDLRDRVRALQTPTLVLVGTQDEATPPDMARELAALLPRAHFAELDGCAHVPQLQAPDRVMAAIQNFLSEPRPLD